MHGRCSLDGNSQGWEGILQMLPMIDSRQEAGSRNNNGPGASATADDSSPPSSKTYNVTTS